MPTGDLFMAAVMRLSDIGPAEMMSAHNFLIAATSGSENISVCVDCVVGETTSDSASLSPVSGHSAGRSCCTRRHTRSVVVSVPSGRTIGSEFSRLRRLSLLRRS